MKIESMQQLKENAIIINEGMNLFWPNFSTNSTVSLENFDLDSHKGHYSLDKDVIAFIDNDGIFYVIPDLWGVQKLIAQNGFIKANFHIPLNASNYPVEYKDDWLSLWEEKNTKFVY